MNHEDLRAMIGQTYGSRKVLSVFSWGDHIRSPQVLTRCACGYEGRTSAKYLLIGRCTDCGCHNKRNSLPTGQAAFNALYSHLKKRAAKRGHTWGLSEAQVRVLISQNCVYCGSVPSQYWNRKAGKGILYNGLDRQDNAKGYTEENAVPCCGTCNMMKSDSTLAEFLAHVQAIAKHAMGIVEKAQP